MMKIYEDKYSCGRDIRTDIYISSPEKKIMDFSAINKKNSRFLGILTKLKTKKKQFFPKDR